MKTVERIIGQKTDRGSARPISARRLDACFLELIDVRMVIGSAGA